MRDDFFDPLATVVTANGHTFRTAVSDHAAVADAAARLGVPAASLAMYAASGPADGSSIPWVVEDLLIFSLGEMVDAQAGYRWNAVTGEPLPDWPAHWVVVASVSADPFLIDTTQDPCPVLFARHGAGSWSATEVASSMESLVAALAEFEQVLLEGFASDVWDDAGLRPDFPQAVNERVGTVLTADQTARFVDLLH